MSPANKNRIKSLKDFRKLLHQDKPFYHQLTLGDFYLYNWSVEFIFDSIKALIEEYKRQKLAEGKVKLASYIKHAIANIQSVGLALFVALKGFLIKYGLRKNKPYAAFLSGLLSGLLPGLIAAINIAVDIYKKHNTATDSASSNNLQTVKTNSSDSSSSLNKWYQLLLFAAAIFISLAPFLLQRYKNFDWLLKLLDKIYKRIRHVVVKISAKLDLKVRFNADKLVSLAEHILSTSASIAKKFVDGMLIGNLISTGIFTLAAFLEVLYFKRQSALDLLKKLLSDNYITIGIQFAILFLVMVHQELKGKRVKKNLNAGAKAYKITSKLKSIKLSEEINLDELVAQALQYRLSNNISRLTFTDGIIRHYADSGIEYLKLTLQRVQKKLEQITNDKI